MSARRRSLALAQTECQSSLMSQPADPTETGVTFALGPWQEVAPNVFRAVAEPESVNLGLVVGSERALLVDTGSSPAQGAAVRASVAAVTDRPLTAVAVTHWHYDHAFGLAAFADLLTIGHESVRERLGSARGPGRSGPAGRRCRRPGRTGPGTGRGDRRRSRRPAGGDRPPRRRAHRRRPGGGGAGRGRGLRRRSDRVGRAAVVRRRRGTRRLGGDARRRDRADDGHHRAGPRARRPGRPGVRLRAARPDRRPGRGRPSAGPAVAAARSVDSAS